MPMTRTPEKPNKESEVVIAYPSARLASITRKKNEIDVLLNSNPKVTKEIIKIAFIEYQERVDNFNQECMPFLHNEAIEPNTLQEFKMWYNKHFEEITSFQRRISKYLTAMEEQIDDLLPEDSASKSGSRSRLSRASRTSSRSSISSTSSLRNKLAEQRAKHLAEEAVKKKRQEAETKRLAAELAAQEAAQQAAQVAEKAKLEEKHMLEDLESQKRVMYQEALIDEIENIESGGQQSQIGVMLQFCNEDRTLNKSVINDNKIISSNNNKALTENKDQIACSENVVGCMASWPDTMENNNNNKCLNKFSAASNIDDIIVDTVNKDNHVVLNHPSLGKNQGAGMHMGNVFPQTGGAAPQAQVLSGTLLGTMKTKEDQLLQILIKQNEIFSLSMQAQKSAGLPKCEPEVFDGSDIVKYRYFVQTFDAIISSNTSDYSRCFLLLEKYTAGIARQLVRSSRRSDPKESYLLARKELEKKFGDPDKITNAIMQKLNKWSPIKNEDSEAF